MDAEGIQHVLRTIGCHGIRARTRWVQGSCPFASQTHEKKTDNHPSFAVSVQPDDLSFFVCHSCGIKGPLWGGFNDLLWQLRSITGANYPQLHGLLAYGNRGSPGKVSRRTQSLSYNQGPREVAGIKVSPIVASQVELFDDLDAAQGVDEAAFEPLRELSPRALEYLKGPERNLTEDTIRSFGYGWHEPSGRVAVPMRDCKGRLVNISGRTTKVGGRPKWLHSDGFRRDLYLYGEDRIDHDWRICYLVEGMFDVAGIWQRGYPNCLAMLGAWISDFQVEKVVRWFDEVVILRDGDQAGEQGAYGSAKGKGSAKGALQKLSARMRKGARVVDPPEGLDPDQLPADFLREKIGPPPRAP